MSKSKRLFLIVGFVSICLFSLIIWLMWRSGDTPSNSLILENAVLGVSFKPNSEIIATSVSNTFSSSGKCEILFWNYQTGNQIDALEECPDQKEGAILTIEFSPDGQYFSAYGNNRASIWIFNANTNQLAKELFGVVSPIRQLRFSPSGDQILAVSDENGVAMWNIDTGNLVGSFNGHEGKIFSAIYSPDGLSIVTTGEDDTVLIWDAETGDNIGQLLGHTNDVIGASFSLDGQYIVSASLDNTARLWDFANRKEVKRIDLEGFGLEAFFSASSDKIIIASSVGFRSVQIVVWDTLHNKIVNEITDSEPNSTFNNTAFSRKEGKLAIVLSNVVRIWDLNKYLVELPDV